MFYSSQMPHRENCGPIPTTKPKWEPRFPPLPSYRKAPLHLPTKVMSEKARWGARTFLPTEGLPHTREAYSSTRPGINEADPHPCQSGVSRGLAGSLGFQPGQRQGRQCCPAPRQCRVRGCLPDMERTQCMAGGSANW